ncbi:MAG: hypothetical protein RLZZ196_329 [Bacteroidota bacterium]|jgi:hypothetical protein
MWGILWDLIILFSGIAVGRAQATNSDITSKTNYMQNLINEAYEKHDFMKSQWLDAEEKAETWKRRYESLVEDLEENKNGS